MHISRPLERTRALFRMDQIMAKTASTSFSVAADVGDWADNQLVSGNYAVLAAENKSDVPQSHVQASSSSVQAGSPTLGEHIDALQPLAAQSATTFHSEALQHESAIFQTQGATGGSLIATSNNQPGVPLTETITFAGSGMTFVNSYDASVTTAYRSAIITAENFYQSHYSNAVTINESYTTANLGAGAVAQNSFFYQNVSFATLKSVLSANATSADDMAAVTSLSGLADPSGGAGFAIPNSQAKALGLIAANAAGTDDTVFLNTTLSYSYTGFSSGTYDAISAIEHELSESMGRIGGLGPNGAGLVNGSEFYGPMDLFRYSAAHTRDLTGGADGLKAYFSIDGTNLLTQFNNPATTNPGNPALGGDPADWAIGGDSFGFASKTTPGPVSATDLRLIDILGWTVNNGGTLTVAQAQALYASTPATSSYVIADTAAQVGGGADFLQARAAAGTLTSVTLSDPANPVPVSQAQVTADSAALASIVGTYSLQVTNTSNFTYTLASNIAAMSFVNPGTETLTGNNIADVITGSSGADTITFGGPGGGSVHGGLGSDVLHSSSIAGTSVSLYGDGGGTDHLYAGAGNDFLYGNAASASDIEIMIGGSGTVTMTGGIGLNYFYAGTGPATMNGGAGVNIYSLGAETVGDTVNGGSGQNYVYGGAGPDHLNGGSGNDVIVAGSGNQVLTSGAGSDSLFAGAGTDVLYAQGTGSDVDIMNGSTGNVAMNGGAGTNYYYIGAGAATVIGGSGENIYVLGSNAAADSITGGSGANYVYATTDTKVVTFKAGTGVDVVQTGSAADVIEGGGGTLYVWGGAGANTFTVKPGEGVTLIEDWNASATNTINFAGTSLHNFADVQAAEFYIAGTNTTIITAASGTAVWVVGVAPAQLNANEFHFS